MLLLLLPQLLLLQLMIQLLLQLLQLQLLLILQLLLQLLWLLQLLLLQVLLQLLLQLYKFSNLQVSMDKNMAAHILNRTCVHARAAQDVDKESAEAVEAAGARRHSFWGCRLAKSSSNSSRSSSDSNSSISSNNSISSSGKP